MAKKENNLFLGITESDIVDSYMEKLQHPLNEVVVYIRNLILSTDDRIGEGIYWNAPTFYFTGAMPPFDVKKYKRYIVGFVFNKQDCIRLVFLRGAEANDPNGLLEGKYTDGRRLVTFTSIEDVKNKESYFTDIIHQLIDRIDQ